MKRKDFENFKKFPKAFKVKKLNRRVGIGSFYIYLLLLALPWMWMSCGKGVVEISPKNYQPKIVIEGYLYPHHPVGRIKISRNFPLNSKISRAALLLPDARVFITDLGSNRKIGLLYDSREQKYYDPNDQLDVEYGRSYRLEVAATVDGRALQASAVTRVPQKGFAIDRSRTRDSLYYLQKDLSGRDVKPQIFFSTSPGTNFYGFSIVALDTALNNFIFPPENPFLFPKWGVDQVKKNFEKLIQSRDQIFDVLPGNGRMDRILEWFHFMFYGRYRIVAYAGDDNMKDYYFTFKMVMEMDGNLHEPVMHIDGDGIGIFGSAIADTLFFKVKRPPVGL